MCGLPLPQFSLGGLFPGLREGVASCRSWASVSRRAEFVLGLRAPLAPGETSSWPQLRSFPPRSTGVRPWVGIPAPCWLEWAQEAVVWWVPQGHAASQHEGGSGPLGGRAVMFRPRPALWSRLLRGHFDGEDRCPLRTGCRPPPLVTMEHTWLLPVGDSMNINTPYFTFITFLLGFHGDGACE